MLRIFTIAVLAFVVMWQAPYGQAVSDHFKDGRFFNPWGVHLDHGFTDFLKWQFSGQAAKWPESVENLGIPEVSNNVPEGHMVVTFVNHSTFLVQLPGINILTDPVWSERVSPVSWTGPKRVRVPGLAWHHLPKIHVVLISHNHYDHLDLPTLHRLYERDRPLFMVGLGVKKFLEDEGLKRVIDRDWWEASEIKIGDKQIKVTFVPAQHFSGRSLWDRNATLWGGFVVESDAGRFYHAGDSGYAPHFKDIGTRFPSLDLAMLPIGAYEPRWFMKMAHVNPEEAVQAHLDLGAKQSVGMHFGTFQLTDESIDDPIHETIRHIRERNIDPNDFKIPQFGETFIVKRKDL